MERGGEGERGEGGRSGRRRGEYPKFMVGVVNTTDLNDVFVPAERLKQISGRDVLLGTTNSMNVNLPNNE